MKKTKQDRVIEKALWRGYSVNRVVSVGFTKKLLFE